MTARKKQRNNKGNMERNKERRKVINKPNN
jgi:hypothetical protein